MKLRTSMLAVLLLSAVLQTAKSCGPSGKQCIIGEADCVGDACVCRDPPYTHGYGNFACFQTSRASTMILNDPNLQNFNGEKVNFPYPCRYLATHIRAELKGKNNVIIGSCEYQIYGFNAKNLGKFFVHGFDLILRLTYSSSMVVERSIRIFGRAIDGNIQYTTKAAGTYLPNGPWDPSFNPNYVDASNGVAVSVYEDSPNQQMVVDVRRCGVRIAFAPYDIVQKRNQTRVPGLGIGVHCAHHPVFLSQNQVVSTGRVGFPGGQNFSDIALPNLSIEESVIVQAFRSSVEQNHPNPNIECSLGHDIFFLCTDPDKRAKAFASCYWMLNEPRFINCIDKTDSGETITSLFNQCVESHCQGTNTCLSVIGVIVSNNCDRISNIRILARFVNGELC